MRNSFFKPIRFIVCLFSFLIFCSDALAQKSVPGNEVHDKMYFLIQESNHINLPENITKQIQEINKEHPYKDKMIFAHISFMKVLYNPSLSKNDIAFFAEKILEAKSEKYSKIHFLVKQQLEKINSK